MAAGLEMAGRLRDRSDVCARRHLAEQCVPARWLERVRQGFFVPQGRAASHALDIAVSL